jgi:hypothetical protein
MAFGKIYRKDKMILKGKNKVYKEAMNKKTIYTNRDKILKPFNYIFIDDQLPEKQDMSMVDTSKYFHF